MYALCSKDKKDQSTINIIIVVIIIICYLPLEEAAKILACTQSYNFIWWTSIDLNYSVV